MKKTSFPRTMTAGRVLVPCIILLAISAAVGNGSSSFSAGAGGRRATPEAQPRPQRNPLPAERIREIQLADRDILGDAELAAQADPSFESVASWLPAMKRPREIVGVKHHPHDIGVAPDASLELSDDVDAPGSPVAFFEVGTPPVRFGASPESVRKTLWHGCLPVVVATARQQDCLLSQTIFGWSKDLSPDAELSAFVSLEAKNLGKAGSIPVRDPDAAGFQA